MNEINNYIQDDNKGQKFSSKLSTRIAQLKQEGALPYILLSITDDNGNPFNQLLPPRAQKFIFDILWGIPGNSIIVTPLIGVLTKPNDYGNLIEGFYKRQKEAIDRKNQPIMAIVPTSYSLIDPKLIERYWKCGVRIFGYDCANKKYGAYSYTIESLHNELSRLSRESGEDYIINGINSKYKYGKSTTSRINNLIGAGFGFDTYSPNHIQAKFIPAGIPTRYIFSNSDYGFLNIKEVEDIKKNEEIVNTNALKTINLSELQEMKDYQLKKLCTAHDIEKTIKEIENYPSYIENNELLDYLASKKKIQEEKVEIESLQHPQNPVNEWYK
ncbi:MAG: hypothetical protein ABR985_18425 [Methanotrichaceae archaeon]